MRPVWIRGYFIVKAVRCWSLPSWTLIFVADGCWDADGGPNRLTTCCIVDGAPSRKSWKTINQKIIKPQASFIQSVIRVQDRWLEKELRHVLSGDAARGWRDEGAEETEADAAPPPVLCQWSRSAHSCLDLSSQWRYRCFQKKITLNFHDCIF